MTGLPRALVALLFAAAAAVVVAAVAAGQQPETVVLPEGAVLRLLPSSSSRSLTVIDEEVELPLLERRGDWVRVAYEDWKGWVSIVDGDPANEGPASLSQMDGERLALATSSLENARHLTLGQFCLITDVRDAVLLSRLDRVAARLPTIYAERYGLDPGAEAEQHVVLFSREEDYAAFELETAALRGYAAPANGGGVAVIVAGHRTPGQVIGLLLHELAHLLNRRALSSYAGALPPWLEEGIAEELSYSRVGARGQLEPGTIRDNATVRLDPRHQAASKAWVRLDVLGPQRRTNDLVDLAWQGQSVPLARLATLSWAEFVHPGTRETAYAVSAHLVRFLLAGGGGAHAEPFRGFLREVAAGLPAELEGLWSRLQVSQEAFEREFQKWLVRQRKPLTPRRGLLDTR